MDINLPGISGIEALKILREDPATAHIPVVALSANAMPRDIEKGLQAGFFRYLTKPIKVNEFMETLDVVAGIRGQGPGMPMNPGDTMVSAADILNARILVVDDKEANVQLLEGMLRVAGYTSVDVHDDPNAVCELHRQNRYDLILLDLQMPGMDGFQVMEGLKEIEEDGYLPVLVITAQPAHKLRALEAGAKDFVSKPFDLAELRARVHNILEVRLLHLGRKNTAGAGQTVGNWKQPRGDSAQDPGGAERSEQELALAQETQESLLPRCLPQFENFRIHAFNTPTRYVGGDFYDFLQLSSGDWMGVLADVSGKGMSAALLSSMVLGALSMEFHCNIEPRKS